MKSKRVITAFLIVCVALSFYAIASAQDLSVTMVTVNFSYGGLLWINGTSVVNGSTLSYPNGSVLDLAATPTNANYSYASMDLNGTVTTDNPILYTLVGGVDLVSNQTITVLFVAEAVPTPSPTPDPNALTPDDAVGIAVAFGVVAIGVCVALVFTMRRKENS
jgi:hypothetical protein